ncbi:MAG: IMP dehydrogenase [Chloroflexota bacterium]|jgi:IMP dehydrogenase|nr:IMP dehydrogenase [Chloroflexota bacterium]MDP6757524.1 IMP dehydrogenase [Chloroflexota bacterium]
MTSDKFTEPGLTFDDVLLVPGKSDLLPADAELGTRLTARVSLNAPFLSSPMDTVTEAPMAIAMAREGALGIIHRNLSIHDQATEVDKVKRSQSGMITDPITLHPGALLEDAHALMERYHISGVPVTEPGGRLVGILTNRDIRFCNDEATPITELMTHEDLITVPEGTTLSDAEQILHRHRVEKLLVVDDDYQLKGLITVKDLTKREQFPGASFDRHGRLLVGAAVGVGEEAQQRARELVDAGVDVLVCDTAHGHSQRVIDMTAWIKDHLDIDVISGNVATAGGASDLIAAGADAVRVGVGPATICTTRVVAGVGVPQITAVSECASVCGEHGAGLIADGGIRYSGDVGKAIAAGADAVMIGSLFAGTDESPGEIILAQGERFKDYRGMGSIGAMRARSYSRDRYAQELVEDTSKLVAEGIEGRIPYRGALGHTMAQLTGGLRQSMGYCGTADIAALKSRAQFVIMTQAGLNESHPHDIVITKEAPNYQVRR